MNQYQNIAMNESYNTGYDSKIVGLLILFISIPIFIKISVKMIDTYFLNGKGNRNYSW